MEGIVAVVERYAILLKAADRLGFKIKNEDELNELKGKHYYWSQQQIAVSGLGAVDYWLIQIYIKSFESTK